MQAKWFYEKWGFKGHRPISVFVAYALVVFGIAIALAPMSRAQQGTGNIVGTVYDSSQAVLPNASIQVTNLATGAVIATKSNEVGLFATPPLISGVYEIAVTHDGFKRKVTTNVIVDVGSQAHVDLTLSVGQQSETVTATANPPELNTANAILGITIDPKLENELPVNGRDVQALAQYTPGVRNPLGPNVTGLGDRGDLVSGLSINGSPAGGAAFIFDGLSNEWSQAGGSTVIPFVDSVHEFKVVSGTVSADYGFTLGGALDVVSRSGTNQYHGAVYEFFRNDAMDARNYFAYTGTTPKPEFRFNQFGGSMGGPILHKKTFFFVDEEEYHYIKGIPTYTTVPTLQERGGDFSDWFGANGVLIQLYDPRTTTANPNGPGYVRQPFAGNIIPSSSLDAAAVNFQNDYYPKPNVTPTNSFTHANNYFANVQTRDLIRQSMGRVDHQFSANDFAFARYFYYDWQTNNPVILGPIAGRNDNMLNQSTIVGETHTFSSSLLNDFRLGVVRSYFTFTPGSANQNIPQKIGLPSSVPPNTAPAVSNGLPAFNTTGGVRANTNVEFVDTATKTFRSHIFKVGTEFRRYSISQILNGSQSGSYTFTSALTGNPQSQSGTGSVYASFLLGQVGSGSITELVGLTDLFKDIAGYVQDDWKVSDSFTLNAGLRYEYQEMPFDQNNHYSNWNSKITDSVNGLLGAFQYAGVNGIGRNFTTENYRDFSPRIGFAWTLTPKGTTVLRAGYGILYGLAGESFGNPEQGFTSTTSYNAANSNYEAFQFSAGLPSAPIPPQGAALGPAAYLGQAVSYVPNRAPTAMTQLWNLSVEQQLPWGVLAEMAYVGTHGTFYYTTSYNTNVLNPSYLSLGLALQNQVPNPYYGIVPSATSLGGPTISKQQSLLPFPYYTTTSISNSHDGGLEGNWFQLSVQKRATNGLIAVFGYTAGKTMSTPYSTGSSLFGSQPLSYQNVYDRAAERSLDPADVSQRGTLNLLYDLPFGRGQRFASQSAAVNNIIGGWQMDDITVIQTGIPIAIQGANNNVATRPNYVSGVSLHVPNPSKTGWFNTAAFVNPPTYTFGNVPRVLGNVRAPKAVDFDFSLHKRTPITEKVSTEFRVEMFNIFNHPNFSPPNGTFSPGTNGLNASGTFGTITSTSTDNRDMQLSLRIMF